MKYEDTGLYQYGLAMKSLGEMFMNERTELADLVDHARACGVQLRFAVVPMEKDDDPNNPDR